MSWLPPAAVVWALLVLVLSQILYALWPYRRRRYLPALLLTAAGVAAGQVWDWVGLPGVRLGAANLLPAVVFAIALQPLAERLHLRLP